MISKSAKITILGLGLLGGSYAKGLFQANYKVYGIDIDPKAIEYAKKMKWIVDGSDDPKIAEGSDIVISAVYPNVFIQWVKDNQKYLKPGSILTDVTGVKREVVSQIQSILREDVEFIACHPMAGREYKGIAYADCGVFKDANFIIVPTEKNTERGMEVANDIANILKFKNISILTPEEHDQVIGFVTQLTHIIAISLMNISENPKLVDYTGDSFRDLTRIANINEDLWPELFVYNKDYLMEEIDQLVDQIHVYRDLIEKEDLETMRKLMIQATERRKQFGRR